MISVLFVVVHVLFFAHSALHPESFTAGDRAGGRPRTIESVFGIRTGHLRGHRQGEPAPEELGASSSERLLAAGNPGDYMLQGALPPAEVRAAGRTSLHAPARRMITEAR